MHFFVRDYLVANGYSEDGEQLTKLVYFVVAEADNGARIAHRYSFDNEADAEKLCKRIRYAFGYGRPLNLDHWDEIDPAYGSEAYQVLDNQRFFRNREIDEAHDAGEISEYEANRLKMF